MEVDLESVLNPVTVRSSYMPEQAGALVSRDRSSCR